MRTPTQHYSRHQIRADAQPQTTVCIVDPHAADYDSWHGEAASEGVQLHICTTADEALRVARTHAVSLWVVNTDLAGLSGCELCAMLKSRSAGTPVYLVADHYTPDAERAAWSARATLFGCKGAHATWLREWLHNQSPRISGATVPSPSTVVAA